MHHNMSVNGALELSVTTDQCVDIIVQDPQAWINDLSSECSDYDYANMGGGIWDVWGEDNDGNSFRFNLYEPTCEYLNPRTE